MLAYIDYSEPHYYNSRTILLLLGLGFLAWLVSPLNAMPPKERAGLLLVCPALILVYWFMFQVGLLSLNPSVHFYLGPTAVYAWMTNSYLCLGFGALFSLAIVRSPGPARRAYGGLFLALYLLLLAGGITARPPVMST